MGNFDGVHAGHTALLAAARRWADDHDAKVIAMSFDPHPVSLLRPDAVPARLTTFTRRRELLLDNGADEVRRIEPSPELLAQSPRAFIERLAADHHPIAMVEGSDFRFGKARAGDVGVLAELGSEFGFELEVVKPVAAVLGNQQIVTASSTLARTLIESGRVTDAWALLGRPYELAGTVERGDRRGRTIGVPTANVRCETLLPADGVYAAMAQISDGRWWPAAINVGSRPTFDGIDRRVEAHLIGAHGGAGGAVSGSNQWTPIEGLTEYGWDVRLQLVGWVRDQVRFAGIDSLVAQLRRDISRAAALVRRRTMEVA